nr:DNA-binding protein [Acinetobacter sp. UGAL515B_02]
MNKRPTKIDRMTPEEKLVHTKQFWIAPNDAVFPPETIAVVFNVSLSWLQLKDAPVMVSPTLKVHAKLATKSQM